MRVTKTKNVEVEYTDDIICNKCGNSLKHLISTDNPPSFNYCGLEEAIVHGTYGSDPLEDCTDYIFSLCEKCLYELFNTFKIPVKEQSYSLGDYRPPRPPKGDLL